MKGSRWLGCLLALLVAGSASAQPQHIKGQDGGEMVRVPAGEFWMGSDESAPDQTPKHRVYLDTFSIDQYETTNVLYKRFMDATGRAAPAYWSDSNFNGSSQPVVGVSWDDADAYCKWAGKRLPTEAEWEKAARGTDGRDYPWGNQWESFRANSLESKPGKPTPVGSYPEGVSPYGAHDMAGNASEWVADWYDENYYKTSPARNPQGPGSGEERGLHRGSWIDRLIGLRAAYRQSAPPDNRDDWIGFRCARGGQ